MKRSLLIAIAVLLIAALFVGCSADKIEEDQLVEVTIASDNSRGLIAEGASTANVADLYWYYSAEKTAGYFKTGETSWKAVKEGKGLEGSLGEMSTGGWNFCFYGFKEEQATKPSEPEATAIFYQKNLRKAITGPVALDISLSRGAGSLGDPIAVFGDDLFWDYDSDIGTVTLTITNNGEPVHVYEGTPANGAVTFSTEEDEFALSVGSNVLAFKVVSSYTIEGVAFEEQLGYSELNIAAESGMKYTITCDDAGIDFYPYGEATPVVSIGEINVPVTATATVVASTTAGYASKVETSNTPAASTTAKTTVEFPVDLAGKNVTVETSSAEVASSKSFVVSAGSGAVASIELSISDGTKTFGEGNKAQVTTFIGTGLVGVEVHYSGTDAADIDQNDVSYDPDTGYVTFLTPHFSEFYVTAEGEAQIGTKVYKTFADAIAAAQDGSIITLLKEVTGTISLTNGSTLTLNLNGKVFHGGDMWITGNSTLIVDGTAAGSKAFGCFCIGSSPNNNGNLVVNGGEYECPSNDTCLHINGTCLNSNVTLKNAKFTSPNDNGIQLNGSGSFLIENCIITGATAVYVKSGNLTINGGTYTGNMAPANYSYYGNGANATGDAIVIDSCEYPGGAPTVTINSGAFTGTKSALGYYIYDKGNDGVYQEATINVNGGTFNGVDSPSALILNGKGVFATLAAAVNAVDANDTIIMISDETISAAKTAAADRIVIGKAITLNFGAHTLSVPGELEPTSNWSALYIDADTTIKATTGGIDCLDKEAGGCGVYALNVREGATLTINGGSYHGGGTIVQAQLGRVIITEGEFSATSFEAPYGFDFVLNCVDAAYQAGTASFEVEGGLFYSFNPADNAAEGAHTNFVTPGFVSVEEGNSWRVIPSV